MDAEAIAGRYRLEERLGVGGMAEVWSAHDLELDRRVAIKFLGQGADSERFRREARAVASLSHPNICQLYDYGDDESRPYMVLEYLPGGTLEDRLASGEALADEQSAEVAREIAAGLAHAHERGLVHRDLKPANILFDSAGRAKIADFGIARTGDAGTLTQAGTLLGTVAYLSPEQAAGETATTASDVYGFGVILYRMLSGRLPFESDDALDLARKHREEAPRPLTEIRPAVPPVLESLAMASLAKSPADRPPEGAALLEELGHEQETALLAGGGGEDPTQVLPFARRRPGAAPPAHARRWLFAGLLAVALLGTGIGAAVIATRDGGSARPPQATSSSPTTDRTTATTEQAFTQPVSTQPQTTIESTAPPPESVATTEPETLPTEPPITTLTEPETITVPPPVSTAPTFTEPATTDVPTFDTTEPIPTIEPLPTTEPATTAPTTPPGAP